MFLPILPKDRRDEIQREFKEREQQIYDLWLRSPEKLRDLALTLNIGTKKSDEYYGQMLLALTEVNRLTALLKSMGVVV